MYCCNGVALVLKQNKSTLLAKIHNGTCNSLLPFLLFTVGPVALDSVHILKKKCTSSAAVLTYRLRCGTENDYDALIRVDQGFAAGQLKTVAMKIGLVLPASRATLLGCISCYKSERQPKCCQSEAAKDAIQRSTVANCMNKSCCTIDFSR